MLNKVRGPGPTRLRAGRAPRRRTLNLMTRELKEIGSPPRTESEAVRVAAIEEMFDRGFGKAAQLVEGSLIYGSPMCWLPRRA